VKLTLPNALERLLVRTSGPRTAELSRQSGATDQYGAPLGQLPERALPTSTVQSICGFCATGCSLTVHLREGVPVNITPSGAYPVNRGAACPKGWEALAQLRSPDRLTTPLVRDDSGSLLPVDWDIAAKVFCDRMRAVQRAHGPSAVAFLSTGQIPTEEMALLGAFTKFQMGMVHGDGNTRQCMATSAVAHKESFGFDSPPFTYEDFEESDVIVLIGSNLCIAHPIMWERIVRNRHGPEIVVIDPRRTETAAASSVHIQPSPGSDLVLLMSVAHVLVELEAVNLEFVNSHTTGFAEWKAAINDWSPEVASAQCAVPPEQIRAVAQIIAEGKRVSLWWTMGVNQGHQAVRTAQAIINIALMTGNIGRPGTGANSITGQCNAMGSRIFANTTNLFGGRSFTDPAHRAEVASILHIDPARIPKESSFAYDQIIDGIETGQIKALWIIATNTVHSWLDQDRTRCLLEQLDFLVVQDLFADTATASIADLVLPAAGWGEKDGTFINAERRLGRIRRFADPPGHAKSDFDIVKTLAAAWGDDEWITRWSTPGDAFARIKELSAGRPCDMTEIEFEDLDRTGMQWPQPNATKDATTDDSSVNRRLFADGHFFHADGKARFVTDMPVASPETVDVEFPLVLLTGRQSSAQWHTGTRTERSAVLRSISVPIDVIQLNPADAALRNISHGDPVVVRSRRGSEQLVAFVSPIVRQGEVFGSMHHPSLNRLTRMTIDPHSRQPAAKQSCVQVERSTANTRDV
jgi:anaerobic selenocysteine-containing dehydrogenase